MVESNHQKKKKISISIVYGHLQTKLLPQLLPYGIDAFLQSNGGK